MKNFISAFKELKNSKFPVLNACRHYKCFWRSCVSCSGKTLRQRNFRYINAYFARNSCMVQFITYTYFT